MPVISAMRGVMGNSAGRTSSEKVPFTRSVRRSRRTAPISMMLLLSISLSGPSAEDASRSMTTMSALYRAVARRSLMGSPAILSAAQSGRDRARRPAPRPGGDRIEEAGPASPRRDSVARREAARGPARAQPLAGGAHLR